MHSVAYLLRRSGLLRAVATSATKDAGLFVSACGSCGSCGSPLLFSDTGADIPYPQSRAARACRRGTRCHLIASLRVPRSPRIVGAGPRPGMQSGETFPKSLCNCPRINVTFSFPLLNIFLKRRLTILKIHRCTDKIEPRN